MSEAEQLASLIGDVYDAALDPALWLDVLAKSARFVGGFTAALFLSPFWREHQTLGLALFLVLLAIPVYVALLISRLHAATQHLEEARGEAEAANRAKSRFIAAASHDWRLSPGTIARSNASSSSSARVVAASRGVNGSARTPQGRAA